MKMKSESEVAQSPTLSDPMDCSLPGSSVHGIFQARVLERGAIAFSVLEYKEQKNLQTHLGPVQSSIGSNGRFWQFTTYRVQAEPFCPSQKLGQELNLLALSLALPLWLLSAYENIFQSSPIKALQTFYPAEELILNVWAKLWSFLKNYSINFS